MATSAIPPIYVEFRGDVTSLKGAIRTVRNDLKGVDDSVKKTGGAFTGLKGQMKAAFIGLSFAGAIAGIKNFVSAASDLQESITKADVVFGQNAKAVQDWSKTTSAAFGINRQAALEAAGTYGNLIRAFGLTEQQAYTMSTSLVELAADMASFNNTSVDDALLALRSGLSGETEPLKKFGVALTDVRLREEALRIGLGKYTGMLPAAIKTQAAYSLIMKDTALAQGDMARTADGFANQLRFLQAGLQDAKTAIGEALLPIALNMITVFNEQLLPVIRRVADAFKFQGAGGGLKVLGTEISNVIINLQGTAKTVKDLILVFVGIKIVAPLVVALRASWIAVGKTIEGVATTTKIATGVMKSALISTGIGALIVAAGFLVAKIIEMRIESKATDKTIRIMESNGVRGFGRMSAAAQGTIVTINAAQLAATRLSDSLDSASVKAIKIRSQQGKNTYNPVKVPAVDGVGGVGGTSKADAAAAAKAAIDKAAADSKNLARTMANAALENVRNYWATIVSAAEQARDIAKTNFDKARSLMQSAYQGLGSILDVTKLQDATSSSQVVDYFKSKLASIKEFVANLNILKSSNLHPTILAQIVAAGPVDGAAAAKLLAGDSSAIAELNAAQNEFVSVAAGAGGFFGEDTTVDDYMMGTSLGRGYTSAEAGYQSALANQSAAVNAAEGVANQYNDITINIDGMDYSDPSTTAADIANAIASGIKTAIPTPVAKPKKKKKKK